MDSTSFLWSVLTTIVLAYIFKWILWRLSHHLPPGPWGLPIFGYKPFLSALPHEDYLQLGKKYGNIFGLHLGCRYTVVLNDFSDIKEAYNKEEFSDRPPSWFKFSDDFDHLVNMNGWEWKESRRFVVTALRNLGMGKNKVEESIQEEISQLIKRLEKSGQDCEVNLMDTIYLPLLNVILTITCGRPFDDGERLLSQLSQYNHDIIKYIYDYHEEVYYPFLKPFFWLKKNILGQSEPSLTVMADFIRKETKSHKEEFDENNLQDFIAYFLNEMQNVSSSTTSFTGQNLHGNAQSLVFAGTDTTRITMTWIFLSLVKFPDKQEKMYQEIVNLLGKEKPPSWSDKDDLPYTDAFIMESTRYNTLAAADDPHWSGREGTIGGFYIPKDTILIANVGAVHKDKKLWGDPENFKPERFLSPDGKKATAPEYLIPFLTGKRACPGAKLANMQLFLFVAALVQRFQVVAPKSGFDDEAAYFLMNFPIKPIVSFKVRN